MTDRASDRLHAVHQTFDPAITDLIFRAEREKQAGAFSGSKAVDQAIEALRLAQAALSAAITEEDA